MNNLRPNASRMAWIAILLYTSLLLILSLWGGELASRDPPRVAGIAREMAFSADYFVPRLNGQPFLEYPSLGYAPIALFLSASAQPSEFIALLPMALIGVATVWLTYLIGKRLEGERVGIAAGALLATTAGFFMLHRRCLVDPTLLFCVTLSLYGFVAGYGTTPKSFRHGALFYLGMAGGFLAKGLIGILIPSATVLTFLLWRRDLAAVRKLRLVWGAAVFIAPLAFWVAGVYGLADAPGGIVLEVITQSIWRFFSSSADHAAPFYFYFGPVLVNLLPWLLLPLVLLWIGRGSGGFANLFQRPLAQLSLAWFAVVFLGLSLASAKRVLYLGPLYPPFALLAALCWDRLAEAIPRLRRLVLPGLLAAAVVYLGLHFFLLLPGERQESLRTLFKAAGLESQGNQIYLVDAPEALRGAAVFYLGKTVPEIRAVDFQAEGIPPGSMLIMNIGRGDQGTAAKLETLGFRLLKEQFMGNSRFCLYAAPAAP